MYINNCKLRNNNNIVYLSLCGFLNDWQALTLFIIL